MLLGNVPCLGVHGDDREAHLQDPAVHDFAHRERQLDGRLIVHSLGQSRMGQLSAGPASHPTRAAQPLQPWPLPRDAILQEGSGEALGWEAGAGGLARSASLLLPSQVG